MTISFHLQDQVAFVTGGSSGLGEAIAHGFADAGAAVVITGRDRPRLDAVVAALRAKGVEALGLVADVRQPSAISASIEEAYAKFGKVDALVNSAGIFSGAPALETSLDDWNDVLLTNVTGPFLYCREIGARMVSRGYGRIVNITSTDAFTALPNEVAYCTSKSALVAMTQVMAIEWIKSGVNVNAVAPCDFDTPMTAAFLADDATREWVINALPVGRIGRPEEIVAGVLYLSSPEAAMVVGHTLNIDGGRRIV